MKKMLYLHVPSEDTSTISKAGIFSITYPSPDVFLVIRVSSFFVMLLDTTISKAGIFSITYPSPDVFLVIRVSSFSDWFSKDCVTEK